MPPKKISPWLRSPPRAGSAQGAKMQRTQTQLLERKHALIAARMKLEEAQAKLAEAKLVFAQAVLELGVGDAAPPLVQISLRHWRACESAVLQAENALDQVDRDD